MALRQRRSDSRGLARARPKDSLKAFAKLTRLVDGQVRISSDPPFIVPLADLVDGLGSRAPRTGSTSGFCYVPPESSRATDAPCSSFVRRYVAHKVVGVGSVGTRCWIVLLRGRDERDPLFLQLKEAQASVLEPTLDEEYVNHGQRVVEGQRLMQAGSDIMLGWTRIRRGPRRRGARTLRASALGLEAVAQRRTDHGAKHYGVRAGLRVGPRPGARPLR